MGNYLYKYGNVEVYDKFESPTKESFYKWRGEFLETTNLDNYNVAFVGNAAERIFGISTIPTYDIDIVLSGEIDSYENLFNILTTAFKLGLKNNLCIDIFHIDKDVFKYELWGEYNQIRFYDKIQINKRSSMNLPFKTKELPYGLHKFSKKQTQTNSYNKHISRIKSGEYQCLRFDLKTMKLISFN